jgi:hypothetical protein
VRSLAKSGGVRPTQASSDSGPAYAACLLRIVEDDSDSMPHLDHDAAVTAQLFGEPLPIVVRHANFSSLAR